MHNDGVTRGSTLCRINSSNGQWILGVATEPIDGFGGNRDHLTQLEQPNSVGNIRAKVHGAFSKNGQVSSCWIALASFFCVALKATAVSMFTHWVGFGNTQMNQPGIDERSVHESNVGVML